MVFGVLGYDHVGHIPENAQIWSHMVKPGVWGMNVYHSRELGKDSVNLPPDPGKKGSEWQMDDFGTNRTFGRVCKAKKANDRTNWAVIGQNGATRCARGTEKAYYSHSRT